MFDWDGANIAHIAEHGVAASEAEEVITNDPFSIDYSYKDGETRYREIGETHSGRVLVVVSTIRNNLTRVITAYEPSRTLRMQYLRQKELDFMAKNKTVLPEFKSEAEEAKWWFDHQEELDRDFAQAAAEGRLQRGRDARAGAIPTTTIRLDPVDIEMARTQAEKKGLKYQTYLKMLLHEALTREAKAS